jgi:hypothetical protein
VACTLIGLGLVVQFLTHLFGFAKKRARSSASIRPLPKASEPFAGTVLAIERSDA